MSDLTPFILGNIDASDAPPALQQILRAVDTTTILAITDAKGIILHVNDRFCEISKYSREELVGQSRRIVKSDYHPKSFFVDMWRTICSGKTWNAEIKNIAKDGSYYWVETSIVPFFDDVGELYRFAAIRKDITDKKNLTEQIELERAKSLHSEKMAALGEMAAGIAHEVGNPLAALRGRAEMLKMKAQVEEIPSDEIVKTTNTILALVDRTSKIIKGLKSYARDASGDPMQEVDVVQMVEDILDFASSRIEKAGVGLKQELTKKLIRAHCREAEISQVLVNLVNNACDVLAEGSERKLVVRVFSRNDDVVIEVEDSGPGVHSQIREKIFEPFFTTKAVGSGTGLGLSIGRRIMESHGGGLSLKDEDRTCFELYWPISRAKD